MPEAPSNNSTATIGKVELWKFEKTDMLILVVSKEDSAVLEVDFRVVTEVAVVTACEEDLVAVVASAVDMGVLEATAVVEAATKADTAVVAVTLAVLLLRLLLPIHSLILPQPVENGDQSSLFAMYVSWTCQEAETNEHSYHGPQATMT